MNASTAATGSTAWRKRYRAVVARAEATSLGTSPIPTREQLFATRRSVRAGWWARLHGADQGWRDASVDAKLQAADEALARACIRFEAAAMGVLLEHPVTVVHRHGGPRLYRYDATLTEEQKLERKRARQQALRLERIASGLCAACGRLRDREGKTCTACLDVDRQWRRDRTVREQTAEYMDEECQPLILRKPARMLPVIGERLDCVHERACVDELIDACGRQDPQGASCPRACPHFLARDRRAELAEIAMSRAER